MFSDKDKQFIREHQFDDVRQLALHSKSFALQTDNFSDVIIQITGRQLIAHKLPSWHGCDELIFPARLSLEQCSSESTAIYKTSLFTGKSFIDLTGGFGVDCAFISKNFDSAVYVECQQELCSIAKHNFASLSLNHVIVENTSAIDYLAKTPTVDCIYLDPARRAVSGAKTVAISDCEPNVESIKNQLLEKAGTVAIKMSPMLDISLALQSLPETRQIHVVSVDNECKELIFILNKDWNAEPEIICVNLLKDGSNQRFSFYRSVEKELQITYASQVKTYLYEPNTSLLKSGAYKTIAQRYSLEKLHPDSHLYTSSLKLPDFPGRSFRVQSVFSFHKNDLKTHLQDLKQANISVRNFPLKVDELRKKLKLKEGGEIYLFATTLADGSKVLVRNIRK